MRSMLNIAALAATAVTTAQAQSLGAVLSNVTDLSTLAKLVTSFPDLLASLSSAKNTTILAPTNAAFAAFMNSTSANATLANSDLVQAILSYHVLNGTTRSSQISDKPAFIPTMLNAPLLANVTGGQRVEALAQSDGTVSFLSGLLASSNVTTPDIAYDNGIIHVINAVLTPPALISTTATELGLSAIAGALSAAKLVDTLDTLRDVTVFVPANEAFAAIASVLQNASVDTLTSVLGYHVISGSVLYSADVGNGSAVTLNGASLRTTVAANGSVFVNQARVVVPNVLVANGVVHVIDSVLNPNASSAAPGNSTGAFPGASSASDVPFTSGVPTPTGSAFTPASASDTMSTSMSVGGAAGAAMAMATGVVGAGVLFAGALMAL